MVGVLGREFLRGGGELPVVDEALCLVEGVLDVFGALTVALCRVVRDALVTVAVVDTGGPASRRRDPPIRGDARGSHYLRVPSLCMSTDSEGDTARQSASGDPADLVDRLHGVESLVVVCHDSPDPDCLASAHALEYIAEMAGVGSVNIVYGGHITHQQNRAFVNLLALDIEPVNLDDLAAADMVAFVDHAVPGLNNGIPPGTTVDIVVDHHDYDIPVHASYVDLRPDCAATVSIFLDYLDRLGLEPTPTLASAALFALHRETLDFVRGPTPVEYEAAGSLLPLADRSLVERLYGATFTPTTLNVIGEAIQRREVRGAALVSCVGRVAERDALPQAADFLLTLEGVSTVLVCGLVGDDVQMSARSIDPRVDIGAVLRKTFSDVGTAGGHDNMAGARIPLGLFADRTADDDVLGEFVGERVGNRFFEAMNLYRSR